MIRSIMATLAIVGLTAFTPAPVHALASMQCRVLVNGKCSENLTSVPATVTFTLEIQNTGTECGCRAPVKPGSVG